MLVRFPQALTVNDLYSLDRFGEVQLSQQGRSYSYTNQNPPDVVGFAAIYYIMTGLYVIAGVMFIGLPRLDIKTPSDKKCLLFNRVFSARSIFIVEEQVNKNIKL